MGNILKKQQIEPENEMNGQGMTTSEAPSWCELPAPVINGIYQNLSDADKFSMSLVCKTWNEGFNDPSLWRDRVFQFEGRIKCLLNELPYYGESLVVHSGKVSIRFARRFSRLLKRVEIHIFPPFHSWDESIKDLNEFSELFDYSQLNKIHIMIFDDESFNDTQDLNDEFLKTFIRLFERQNSLEDLYICGVKFNINQGAQLLSCLAESCGETLQRLILKEFLAYNFKTVSRTGLVINEVKKFSNLTHVFLDCVYLSDDLLHVWSRKCPKLNKITVCVNHENYVLSCEAWQTLVNTHPELKVHMAAHGETMLSLLILSPVLPLASLTWEEGLCFELESEFTSFLQCLSKYQKTLESLHVKFMANFGDPDHAAVMNILSKFSKLPPLTFKRSKRRSNVWTIQDESYI